MKKPAATDDPVLTEVPDARIPGGLRAGDIKRAVQRLERTFTSFNTEQRPLTLTVLAAMFDAGVKTLSQYVDLTISSGGITWELKTPKGTDDAPAPSSLPESGA